MLVARRRPIADPSRSGQLTAWTNGVQGLVMNWPSKLDHSQMGKQEAARLHFVAS